MSQTRPFHQIPVNSTASDLLKGYICTIFPFLHKKNVAFGQRRCMLSYSKRISRKESLVLNLLARLKSDVGLMLRRPPKQQYAALCYRTKKKQGDIEILLLTSRDTGRWVIPKGWPMPAKKAHSVAEREAFEEAGVKGKADKEPLGHYHYNKALRTGLRIPVRVQVHALEVQDMVKSFPEKGSRRLEWVTPQEAALRVKEPELKSLIASFVAKPDEKVAKAAATG